VLEGISLDSAIKSFCFLFLFSLVRLMENYNINSLLRGDRFTTPVVENSPPPTECIPFKIPLGIIEKVMNDHYAGDGTVHPSVHLLKLTELCELFKISGLTRDEVMRKLFALSLKGKALEWQRGSASKNPMVRYPGFRS
jgi:hypothetical protein